MRFEFVIVYQRQLGEVPIHFILSERLNRVLTDNSNEFDFELVDRMIQVNFARIAARVDNEPPPTEGRTVLGFSLELPDETRGIGPHDAGAAFPDGIRGNGGRGGVRRDNTRRSRWGYGWGISHRVSGTKSKATFGIWVSLARRLSGLFLTG